MKKEESLVQAINEEVALCVYDAAWPHLFEIEREYLLSLNESFIDIQHFGSTAVPGLSAKPIV